MGIGQIEPRFYYNTGWYIDYDRPIQTGANTKTIDYTKIDDDSSFFTYGTDELLGDYNE